MKSSILYYICRGGLTIFPTKVLRFSEMTKRKPSNKEKITKGKKKCTKNG